MKKIPTMFKRNPENMRELLDEPHPDCLWVFKGHGVATRKYDGTCCLIKDGKYFKRREVKKDGNLPDGFIEESHDENTGKRTGWIEVDASLKENKFHMEGLVNLEEMEEGTYELVGPKIQGNPENYHVHTLLKHSEAVKYAYIVTGFNGIREYLADLHIEGLVFHHPDGRMAKIKKRDFGLKR